MKLKSIILTTLALVWVITSIAQESTYVYTANQRFKITGSNIVVNGSFSAQGTNKTAGWTGSNGAGVNAEVWAVEVGAGPNGENVLKSVATTSGEAFCNKWAGLNGTYVVSFDIKGESYANTANAAVANCVDFFINTDGALTKVASTDEAPVINVATGSHFNAEWKTIAFSATVEEDQILVMHFEQLAVGTMITNIQIRPATEVYDIRPLKRKVASVKKVIEDPNFKVNESEKQYGKVAGIIEMIEGMIDTPGMENTATGESIGEGLDDALEEYLAVTSKRVNSLLTGTETSTLTETGIIHRGDNNGLKKYFPNLDLTGGSWRHDPANCDYIWTCIQKGYHNEGTYNVFHVDFPAGKYFIAGSIRNANTDSKTNLSWNLGTVCKIFVGKDSVVTDTIIGEDYQTFFLVGTVDEDGAFRAGFEWPGVEGANGGAFYVRDVEVRAFNQDIEDSVLHVQAWKSFISTWENIVNYRNRIIALQNDIEMPWEKDSLQRALGKWDPFYNDILAKGWITGDGNDSGIATNDELNDWALYQGYTVTGVDSVDILHQYQLSRGYQNTSKYVIAQNKTIADTKTEILKAEKKRDNIFNYSGDKDKLNEIINLTRDFLNNLLINTSDATRSSDEAYLLSYLTLLKNAETAFLASVSKDNDIIDIDFSTPFLKDETDGSIYIAGKKGKMVFSNADMEHGVSSTAFQLGYKPDGGELVLSDVLRVGNGRATVDLDTEDQPSDNDILLVNFDLWVGYLSGKNVAIELWNASGERIAGFAINRYNSTIIYNDFNNQENTGLDILSYVSGLGRASIDNDLICVDENKSSFELIINYKNGTIKGTVENGKNGLCEGVEIPIPELSDNKVARFVLSSNYNNYNRRCWFDNLLIRKYSPRPIVFADAKVKSICVSNWDTDGDGELDMDEAAAVTDLGEVFKSNRDIKTFDELQYFTGLTSIGDFAFNFCSSLTFITIPNSVMRIGSGAFGACYSLESITIPNSVTQIGWGAFNGCYQLSSVTIPNSVKQINSNTFSGCSSLTSINIPNRVTQIGWCAFSGCYKLTSITIPNSVTQIDSGAFQYCYGLTSVTVESGNTAYDSRDNCNAIIEKATNTLIMGCQNTIIPNSVTSIGNFAFSGCSGLTSITIPEGVTSIGDYAFSGCSALTSITIPDGVTGIDWCTFAYCSNLSSITVESGNTAYDSRDNCNAIIEKATSTLIMGCQNTIIPNNVTSIGQQAFYSCSGLSSITIPNSVTSIGGGAFTNCDNLTSITLPENLTNIGDTAFWHCRNLASIVVKNSSPITFNESYFLDPFNYQIYDQNYAMIDVTLYVPKDCKSVYAAADVWKNFNIIKEFPDPDVNQDGYVDVVDVVDVARFVVGTPSESFDKFLADLNGSGEVNVADAVALVNEIAGDANWARTLHAPTLHAPAVSDGILTLTRNADQSLSFSLKDNSAYTAFQFDLIMPEEMDVMQMTLNSVRKQNHQVLFNKIGEGHYRVVVLSTSNESFKGKTGELLNITIDGVNTNEISVHDIHFVTRNGTEIIFDALSLSGTVTNIANVRTNEGNDIIFDLQGRRLSKTQRGVNIVDGKKVIVK